MAADVAQYESSNIKCYTSAFSNILISGTRVFWSWLCVTQIGDYFGTYSFVI